jgi:hypothetical protein
MVQFINLAGGTEMEICDVCGKDLDGGYQSVGVYKAGLIKRGVNKGKMGSSVASEYGKFEPVTMRVCKRHQRGFWNQRFIPGFIAFILFFIPLVTLVSFIPVWNIDNRPVMLAVGVILSLSLVYLLVRRITFDGYIASLLTLNPKNRKEKIEFFGKAKYQRLMRNFSRLDAVLKEDLDKK